MSVKEHNVGVTSLRENRVDSVGETRPTILFAASFVILELVVVTLSGLPELPFVICSVLFIIMIAWVSQQQGQFSQVGGRVMALLMLLKTFAVCIGITGGAQSPFTGILFLPVFLGALYFGRKGAIAVGVAVAIFFLALVPFLPFHDLAQRAALTQGGVFLLVSFATGFFTHRLQRAVSEASLRANEQETRASEFEWFTDTAVMMQSLYDLEHMLSAALLRLDELLPADCAAIFLRDPDDPQMSLAQTIGIKSSDVGLQTLSLSEQAIFLKEEFSGLLLSDVQDIENAGSATTAVNVLRRFDSRARSVLIVPLRTLDDLFGVIYVVSHQSHHFTERDRQLLIQYARHVVYPIQRVRLQAMATTDALTGLNNRRAFRRRIRDEVERAKRYSHSLSLVMIDIDFFKRANDTYGHQAGDALLAQVGGILRRTARAIDFAARYGGEEMVVICPETNSREAMAFGERIRANVENYRFELPDGGEARLTVSVGIASVPTHATDTNNLIEAADRAMFEAKEAGRNQVHSAASDTTDSPEAAPTPLTTTR